MPEAVYRPATLDDAELAADLMTAAYPSLPQDPVIWRYRWANPRQDYRYGRYLASVGVEPVAFLGWVHGPWAKLPDRHCEVEVWLDRAHLDAAFLLTLWRWIEGQALSQGAGLLLAYCGEDEPEMLASLAELGYRRERIEKASELDLVRHGPRLKAEAAECRRRMAESGIELTTLAAWQDAGKLARLHELDAVTRQDIPTSLPILAEALEDFERRTNAPDRRPDRTWIALDAGRPVAMSYLKFPPVRGTVWTGYTCSHPAYRGRGLAQAVKLQTLDQAIELGIPVVCTDNDAANAPMLHINDALGYAPRPGFVEHHKRVTSKGA